MANNKIKVGITQGDTNGIGRDLMRIPVAPGVYIVRAGNTCVKIMAR